MSTRRADPSLSPRQQILLIIGIQPVEGNAPDGGFFGDEKCDDFSIGDIVGLDADVLEIPHGVYGLEVLGKGAGQQGIPGAVEM